MKRELPNVIVPDIAAISRDWRLLRPVGGFPVMLMDFPWLFRNHSAQGVGKNPVQHYPCMEPAYCLQMPLEILAAKDCALFFWCTWPLCKWWLPALNAMGFEFSGLAWEWIKFNPATGKYWFSTGYGTRKNVEPCLLATRGQPRFKQASQFFGDDRKPARNVRDFIEQFPDEPIRAPRREHSRKPAEQYARIEAMFDGPYVELFARHQRPGWTAWGSDLGKFAQP